MNSSKSNYIFDLHMETIVNAGVARARTFCVQWVIVTMARQRQRVRGRHREAKGRVRGTACVYIQIWYVWLWHVHLVVAVVLCCDAAAAAALVSRMPKEEDDGHYIHIFHMFNCSPNTQTMWVCEQDRRYDSLGLYVFLFAVYWINEPFCCWYALI